MLLRSPSKQKTRAPAESAGFPEDRRRQIFLQITYWLLPDSM